MDTNPIKTAITVCSELIQRQVSRKKRKNATSTDEKFTDSGEKIVWHLNLAFIMKNLSGWIIYAKD